MTLLTKLSIQSNKLQFLSTFKVNVIRVIICGVHADLSGRFCSWMFLVFVTVLHVCSTSESLSVDDGEDGVREVAQTLQSCLEQAEPVQQIQLVKKVSENQM